MLFLEILLIVAGIVAVLYGADRMTEGAVALAKRMNIPEIVIGLTVVAIGTSAPELFVSLVSAVNGTADLAVGNVVGSNIFNVLLIAGMASVVAPIVVSKTTVWRDLPIAAVASALLIVLCLDSQLSRIDSALLFAGFIVFVLYTIRQAKTASGGQHDDVVSENSQQQSVWKALGLIVFGLVLLIAGSNIFVDNATKLAAALGVSEAVIGLTIVAGGTSLPELATSVVAARKGQSAIAMGNVLGSNIFNVLLILGFTGIISPMNISEITTVDLTVMLGSIVILWLFSFTKLRVERWEGVVLLLIFAGYMWWLLA